MPSAALGSVLTNPVRQGVLAEISGAAPAPVLVDLAVQGIKNGPAAWGTPVSDKECSFHKFFMFCDYSVTTRIRAGGSCFLGARTPRLTPLNLPAQAARKKILREGRIERYQGAFLTSKKADRRI